MHKCCFLILTCAAAFIGCYKDVPLPEACYEQLGVTYRASEHQDCPLRLETKEAALYTADVAGADVALLQGHDAIFEPVPYFDVYGTLAVGVVYLDARRIYVARVDYSIAVLRHEELHVFFYWMTGDADSDHSSELWALVNFAPIEPCLLLDGVLVVGGA